MKKLITIVAALAMVLALAGCGAKQSTDYSSYVGKTYEGTSPWGGTLTVVVDEVKDGELSYQFLEACGEGWGYHIELKTKLTDGKGEFKINETNENNKAEYTGTIELKDDTVVLTYADGQKTTLSDEGGSGYEAVGALEKGSEVVVLKAK